ncbi:hypothetical protein I6I28_03510 [Staphylococcus pettenkoferi]|uniref:hypothetical protein n=1 Tax=Staphylococcus pettenkoferi TaxID=170573 RepID=UPI0014742616|nr:hypothetical protein [Staphylococcus pettenkoferi]QQC38546.1 hypothetical protein I6I28_03510 [Staphylococcus pettenkoferi]
MTEQQETSLQNETDRSKPGQKNTGQSKTQKPQTQPDIKERLIGVGLYLSILVFGYIVMKIYNKLTYVDTSLDMYKNFFHQHYHWFLCRFCDFVSAMAFHSKAVNFRQSDWKGLL